jgi:hypothetical protein
MPVFEVEYEYPVIHDDVLLVEAVNIDEAEQIALDRLSDELPKEIGELDINSIREITKNA